MIHTAAKGQGHLVQKLEVEADVQTDGQTDGGNCLSPVPTRHSILRYNRPTSDIYLPRLLSYRVAKRDTGLMVVGCSPRLVNKLIPGYVKKINTKGGNFALMENIAAVQKACVSTACRKTSSFSRSICSKLATSRRSSKALPLSPEQ